MASKRLNDSMRRAFVNAVMQATPQIDYDEQMRVFLQREAISFLPATLSALYPEYGEYFEHTYFSTPGGFANVSVVGDANALKERVNTTPQLRAMYDAISSQRAAQTEKMQALRQKLRATALNVGTVKSLREAVPELARFVPDDNPEVNRLAPAHTELITDLRAAGLPV